AAGSALGCSYAVFREIRHRTRLAAVSPHRTTALRHLASHGLQVLEIQRSARFLAAIARPSAEKTRRLLGWFEKPGAVRGRWTRDGRSIEPRPDATGWKRPDLVALRATSALW